VGFQGWVFDWFQANAGFFSAVVAQTNMIFLVLTMIVLVAAFNIVSSLVMLVRTKTADIAILRTMGASRAAIMRIFLLDGLAIGGAGTLLGVVPDLGAPAPQAQPRPGTPRPRCSGPAPPPPVPSKRPLRCAPPRFVTAASARPRTNRFLRRLPAVPDRLPCSASAWRRSE